jgi:hypothetical protein
VLIEHGDPSLAVSGVARPLVAFQLYEGGRTAFVGSDETWRWRAWNEKAYDQFWLQLLRSLSEGRLRGGARRHLVLTDKEVYDLGDAVRVSIFAQDEEYRPLAAPSLTAGLQSAGEAPREIELRADPQQAGWFRGIFVPNGVGAHELRLAGETHKTIQVQVPELELQEPELDAAALSELARASGGSVAMAAGIADYASIPDRIPDRSRLVVHREDPRLLWDNALTLAIVVGLLTVEWIGRKISRLP